MEHQADVHPQLRLILPDAGPGCEKNGRRATWAVTTRSGRHQVPVAVLPTAKSLSAFSLKPQSDRLLGFATTQAAYEEAVVPLFETLDWLEERLADRRFLFGDSLTEADIRLFTTLIRFDVVYFGHFKCNIRRLVDYPNLSAYARDVYQWPGIAGTVNFEHIKRHYYESHRSINPSGIVPVGPAIDFTSPHGRERLAALRNPAISTAF